VSHAPIALFVYNRPDHTRQAVEALAANTLAGDTPLHVFSDAPRNEAARRSVEEVRSYIRTITGFRSVTITERETNFGLARSIIEGVTGLCEMYGRVIVVEDDLVTSPHFLSYMSDALARYEYEDQVMQIAGYMFPIELKIQDDALLLPFITSWGWATWYRAWQHFDADAKGYKRLVEDHSLRERFDLGGHYNYFKMLRAQQEGKVDSWAIRWYLSVFLRSGLALYPRKTLVRNLGFDGSGVNCAVSKIEDAPLDRGFQVLSMPNQIAVSEAQIPLLNRLPVPKLSLASMANRFFAYFTR
jgi:GT2 family glycosyltransferase